MVFVLTVAMPRNGEFEYNYRKGDRWNYETLVAPFSFPILKTEEQIKQEKEKLSTSFVPYYNYKKDVLPQVTLSFETVLGKNDSMSVVIAQTLDGMYERGVLPDLSADYAVPASEVIFIQRNRRATKVPVSEVYTPSQVMSSLLFTLFESFPEVGVDSLFKANGLYEAILPNLEYDKQTTEQFHQQSVDFISPTSGTFRSGDVIVSAGEVVTADIEQILDSYKAEFEANVGYNGPKYLLWIANFVLALLLSTMVVIVTYVARPTALQNFGEYAYILLLFLIAGVITFVMLRFPHEFMYLIPYPVFALYFMAFFRKRFVLPLYILCLLPLLIYVKDGSQMFMMYLFSGFIGVFAFDRFGKGWQQFLSALIIAASSLTVYVVFALLKGSVDIFDLREMIFIALGSLFCVFAYPLIYLFEIIFNLVSATRLIELADTNNSLLRTLAQKAPGTFQHSLAVMNMADAAARSIDADVNLVRAAALYHDIGKTVNPQCFVENQTPGVEYHANLSAKESAVDIIHHVQDGLSVAEKHGVPQIVRAFIASHHGTTNTGYFYNRYLNDGGDPTNVADFFYPGPTPETKEQVILMLCDTIEAASRTLSDFSQEKVSGFVENICRGKIEQGQFDKADISLKELEIVKEAIKNYLGQVHHSRIVYPKRNKK